MNSFKIPYQNSLLKYTNNILFSSEKLLIFLLPLIIPLIFSFFKVNLSLIWIGWKLSLLSFIYLLYISSLVLSIMIIKVSISKTNLRPKLRKENSFFDIIYSKKFIKNSLSFSSFFTGFKKCEK